MYHKISQFCDKIDSIKTQADKLRELKYNQPKSVERDFMIDNLILQIQADCYVVSQDKGEYGKIDEDIPGPTPSEWL